MENLELVISKSGVSDETALMLRNAFKPFFDSLKELQKNVLSIEVTDVSQTALMKEAREGRLILKNIRVDADKVRKALKEESNKYNKAVQDIYNEFEGIVSPAEKYLEKQEKFKELYEAALQEELRLIREEELAAYIEFVPQNINLGTLSDDDYDKMHNGAILQYNAKVEADKKAEQERLEYERKKHLHELRKNKCARLIEYIEDFEEIQFGEIEESHFMQIVNDAIEKRTAKEKEIEAQQIENQRLKDEADRKEKELEAERQKQAEILAEQQRLAKIESDKQAKIIADQQAELKRKQDEELAAKQKEAENQRIKAENETKAANAPRLEQLNIWVDKFSLPAITFSDDPIVSEIAIRFLEFKSWAKTQIK